MLSEDAIDALRELSNALRAHTAALDNHAAALLEHAEETRQARASDSDEPTSMDDG